MPAVGPEAVLPPPPKVVGHLQLAVLGPQVVQAVVEPLAPPAPGGRRRPALHHDDPLLPLLPGEEVQGVADVRPVHVARQDQVHALLPERAERPAGLRHHAVPGEVGRRRQVMVRDHDPEVLRRGGGERLGRERQLLPLQAAVAEGEAAAGVQGDERHASLPGHAVQLVVDAGPVVPVGGQEPLPDPVQRHVVVPGRHHQRDAEPPEVVRRLLELLPPGPLGQVAAHDDHVRRRLPGELQRGLRPVPQEGRTEVEIRDVEDLSHPELDAPARRRRRPARPRPPGAGASTTAIPRGPPARG